MDDVWAAHDQFPKQTVVCRCGTKFLSHSRFDGSRIMIVSREKCPSCGKDELSESRGDWEGLVIHNLPIKVNLELCKPRLSVDAVAMLVGLGFQFGFVEHVIQTSLSSLVEETRKRLTYMPFDGESCVLLRQTNSVAYDVLHHICATGDFAEVPIVDLYDEIRDPYKTVIAPTAVSCVDPTSTIHVRGADWPIDRIPLYLDSGWKDFQHVYPMFDWSPVQLWAYKALHMMRT